MNKELSRRRSALVYQEEINHYIGKRKKLDLNIVYNKVMEKYPVVLTNAYALDNGKEDYDEDYAIICGTTSAGKFLLYDNGLDIVFDVEKADGTYTHWHPIDMDDAIKAVVLFMKGTSK